MKNYFDDERLSSAAKALVENMAEQYSPEKVDAAEISDKTVDIKIAKAKAGARRRINRTLRICTIAAVLMIGLVFAVFMGAYNDEKDIYFTREAYLWRINEPSAENIKVFVTIDMEFVKTLDVSNNNLYRGNIMVKDENENLIYDLCHIQLALGKNNIGSMEVYHDEKECPDGHFDENGYRIGQYGTIDFNDQLNDAVIWVFEGDDRIWIHEDTIEPHRTDYSLVITTSAVNRNEAVEKTKQDTGKTVK